MYEIHNLMYFYHRIYPASGPSKNCNEPITEHSRGTSLQPISTLVYYIFL